MEFQTIQEFARFCGEIDSSKSVKTFNRLIQGTQTPELQSRIVEVCEKTFGLMNFSNIKNSDVLTFKTGFINIHKIQSLLKTDDDHQAFNEFLRVFQKLYEKKNNEITELLESLDLPKDSNEFIFMKKLFQELGKEFNDTISSGNIAVETIMPKIGGLIKNGKIMEMLNDARNSEFKMSRVLIAVGKLFEKYENN